MAAKDADAKRFFYASSACVYAADKQTDPNVTALKEDDAYPAMPEDGYGWEKLFSERMCRHFREDFGLTTRVARYHNVYGPNGTYDGGREKAPAAICRKVIEAKLSGKHEIEIWGDGKQTRSFQWIDDCVKGTQMIMNGDYVEPTKTTVAEFVRARIDQWEASAEISARTVQRYRQLLENQIAPYLGTKVLRKLKPLDIEGWHTSLRGTVAARTIGHAHRVLSKALKDAAKNDIVSRNVTKQQPAPKVEDDEMAIVRDVPALVAKLQDWRLGTAAMVALFTGMRLGEVLALRWQRVKLNAKVIEVREALAVC